MTAMDTLEKQDKLYTQLTNTFVEGDGVKCVHPGCGAVCEQGRRPTRCFEEAPGQGDPGGETLVQVRER